MAYKLLPHLKDQDQLAGKLARDPVWVRFLTLIFPAELIEMKWTRVELDEESAV